jgi:hypothetical protein
MPVLERGADACPAVTTHFDEANSVSEIVLSTEATRITDTSAAVQALGEWLTVYYDDSPASLILYEMPPLWFPSGRVTASDGLIMERSPFARDFEPGRYPIELVIADLGGDERVAFAVLRFTIAEVRKWEFAVIAGQDISRLEPGHIFGYPVDSGTGCFADPAAQELINQASDADMIFFDRVTAEMRKVYKHTRDWVRLETAAGSAAIFSSGLGDGFYASYFGLDNSGNAVALMTDFGVVNWPRKP